MEVSDAAAGGGAEVEADVKTVGFEGGFNDLFAESYDRHEVGGFSGIELIQVRNFAKGDGEKMAGIVGKPIEHQITELGAMHDKSRPVISRSRELGERAICLRKSRRFDVFHAPISVQLIHR